MTALLPGLLRCLKPEIAGKANLGYIISYEQKEKGGSRQASAEEKETEVKKEGNGSA